MLSDVERKETPLEPREAGPGNVRTWREVTRSECSRLFVFESDLANSFRRVPMAIRYKLDRCGVHLTLKMWQQLPKSTRRELLLRVADSPREKASFIAWLKELVRASGETDELPHDPSGLDGPWAQMTTVPQTVREQMLRVCPDLDLDVSSWRSLSELERYALVKLSRPGHANRGFQSLVNELFESDDGGLLAPFTTAVTAHSA